MRPTLLALALLGLTVTPAAAQSPADIVRQLRAELQGPQASPAEAPPLALLALVRTLSQRLDTIQLRLDARTTNIRSLAYVDGVDELEPGYVLIQGWAFACDQGTRIAIVIDDIELTTAVARIERNDVRSLANSPTCGVEERPGVMALVDMTVFEPGFQSDHKHVAKIRVYDWKNRMVDSQPKSFTITGLPLGGGR